MSSWLKDLERSSAVIMSAMSLSWEKSIPHDYKLITDCVFRILSNYPRMLAQYNSMIFSLRTVKRFCLFIKSGRTSKLSKESYYSDFSSGAENNSVSFPIIFLSYIYLCQVMRKTSLLAVGVAAILAVAALASSVVSIAFADPPGEDGKKGGPKDEVNNGQCKQEFNDNVCKKFHTGGD